MSCEVKGSVRAYGGRAPLEIQSNIRVQARSREPFFNREEYHEST
jgi:hypothetical protein